MFFFPIRSDRRLNTTPWVNITLIAINALVFLFTYNKVSVAAPEVARFFLDPVDPRLYQFITYQFLHQGLMHIAGNMLFLYVFGNSVEDRMGKVGYLGFYLAGGVIAGFGHSLLESSPVLGASGSVAAVTGAYLALFPMSNITIGYWFLFIGTFEVSGMVLILFQFAQDIFLQVTGGGHVANLAHLSGYLYGFVVGMALLLSRLLPREPYDMLSMLEHYRRRQKFRALTRQGYRPWEANNPNEPPRPDASPRHEPSPADRAIMELRARISEQFHSHNLPQAAEYYGQLLELDGGQVLGRQQQLDVANQLMSAGRHATAARAYELFLNTFRGDAQREQVELILGLLYARYLDRRQRARELLTAALPRLHDASQQGLAKQVLAEIG